MNNDPRDTGLRSVRATRTGRRPVSQFELYPRNQTKRLDLKLFKNPSAEYRGAPFWSWNSVIDLAQLTRQIEQTREMGFGGFHIHSRTGLAAEYLGDEYLRAVVECTKHAKKLGMLSWLYDEDRWPSGFAGGIVTREPRYRIKRLVWTRTVRADQQPAAAFDLTLKDGRLVRYRRCSTGVLPVPARRGRACDIWFAYVESPPPDPWFNNQTNVDVMSKEAIARFIEVTHERFFRAIPREFGATIPAIFTDEPQFTKKMTFQRAIDTRDLLMPWTDDFAHTYRAAYGHDILDHFPELFWNLPDDKPSLARYCYHDHTAQRFAEAFGDQIANWCKQHGIALTGHMLGEATLFSQTRGHGESMRGLRSFQIPGIDILCDGVEFTTAKQAQSVAHQMNRPGVLSELYGVTNWDFDFLGHKAQGDWQAALGVTVRVPHLQWQSMAGEAKRDYPAPIGYQSPWWREYPLIENHFARLNTVLSRGKPLVRVAVIHPIESYWLCFGPLEQNQREMQWREEMFKTLPEWLIYGQIDFDFVSEGSGIAARGSGKTFHVGAMAYDAVIVPSLRTIRSTTLKALDQFAKSGGTVIFAGTVPSLVNAKPSLAPSRLAKRCQRVGFSKREILDALESFREVEIQHEDGGPADSIVHQIRIEGKRRYMFFSNMDRRVARNNARIRIRGKWRATVLDTMTGELHPTAAAREGEQTILRHSFEPAGHLLLMLEPGVPKKMTAIAPPKWIEAARVDSPVPISLSEPNVLLLDQAQWRVSEGAWRPLEEILRLDTELRKSLRLPLRQSRMAQPWSDRGPAPVVADLELKFVIRSEIRVDTPRLALEDPVNARIRFDGVDVPSTVRGWWVDEAIKTISLPAISRGEHVLTLTIPFTRKTNLEWGYLLGDFGVAVSGRSARLTEAPRRLAFGDWTMQGLPFYAGNVTYHCKISGNGGEWLVEVPRFRSPLLSIDVDGRSAGKIAFPPFELSLGRLTGERALDITAYGNRVNAFGPVHHTNENLRWVGPDAWRSTGANWAYEYPLKRTGILTAPILKRRAE